MKYSVGMVCTKDKAEITDERIHALGDLEGTSGYFQCKEPRSGTALKTRVASGQEDSWPSTSVQCT